MTQIRPSEPRAMLSGCAGRSLAKRSRSPSCGPRSQTRLSTLVPVSATTTKEESAPAATPLAKHSPSNTTSGSDSPTPSRNSRPVRVSSMRSDFHSSMPHLALESENQIVPSAVIAALLQKRIRRPSTESARTSTAPVSKRIVSSPRWASHTRMRPSGSHSRPSGRPPVFPIRRIVSPSELTARMEPSAVPV